MAKVALRFLDESDESFITVNEQQGIISIYCSNELNHGICIHLDKSTAIKFAKTLRTEINKIQ